MPHSKALMSYPLGKPDFPEGNKLSTKSIAPEVIDIEGKQPIDYYIDLAKKQPGKKLAFISKRNGTPYMGITYDGSKVKISSGGLAMDMNYIKGGKLNQAYIDKIYSHDPPKFTQKDLPPDVEFMATTYYSSDDDEDPDKGGQKILRNKGRKKEEPEEEEKEMIIPLLCSGKPKDDDYPDDKYPDEGGQIILTKDKPLPDDDEDDKGMDYSFHTVTEGENSDDYELEIALLKSEREKLMKEIETYELEFPMLEKHNQELLQRIKELNKEVDLLRDIETSGKKDLKNLENQYKLKKKEIENMGLAKKDLEKSLQKYKVKHEEKMENCKTLYEKAEEGSRKDIEELSKGYELKIRQLQNEINGL